MPQDTKWSGVNPRKLLLPKDISVIMLQRYAPDNKRDFVWNSRPPNECPGKGEVIKNNARGNQAHNNRNPFYMWSLKFTPRALRYLLNNQRVPLFDLQENSMYFLGLCSKIFLLLAFQLAQIISIGRGSATHFPFVVKDCVVRSFEVASLISNGGSQCLLNNEKKIPFF